MNNPFNSKTPLWLWPGKRAHKARAWYNRILGDVCTKDPRETMIEWGQVDCKLAAYQHHKQDILLLLKK